jgi:chromosome segregation ATPase
MSEEAVIINNPRRDHTDDYTPAWIKIFGGSILSITFLCVITLTGYIVSNINNLQSQVNVINSDMITKKEFVDRTKTIWDTMKVDGDNISGIKERLNTIEQFAKDRQSWMEKYELKITELNKALEITNKEGAAQKERANAFENQLNQLRDEIKQIQKDFQAIRERIVAIEKKPE